MWFLTSQGSHQGEWAWMLTEGLPQVSKLHSLQLDQAGLLWEGLNDHSGPQIPGSQHFLTLIIQTVLWVSWNTQWCSGETFKNASRQISICKVLWLTEQTIQLSYFTVHSVRKVGAGTQADTMEEQRCPACSPVHTQVAFFCSPDSPTKMWCCPQWANLSPVNLQSRQSLTEMVKGLSNIGSSLNEATSSQVTGGSVLLTTKINQLTYMAFCIAALWLILITQ